MPTLPGNLEAQLTYYQNRKQQQKNTESRCEQRKAQAEVLASYLRVKMTCMKLPMLLSEALTKPWKCIAYRMQPRLQTSLFQS